MAAYFRDPASVTLQQQAIKRVREMQQRAQMSLEQQNRTVQQQQPKPPENRSPAGQKAQNNAMPQNDILSQLFGGNAAKQNHNSRSDPPKGIADLLKRQGLGDSISGIGQSLQSTVSSVSQPIAELLESFGIDGEKLIILMVMWAVFNESKENRTLLLALGYLLI